MNIDLDEHRFKQADVLRLVDGLNQGKLQNWVARGIFKRDENVRPKKHSKARWSGISIIAMRFMMQVAKFGIGPTQSIELADVFVQEVDDFLLRFSTTINEETGVEEYFIQGDRLHEYKRMEIMINNNGKFFITTMPTDPGQRGLLNSLVYGHLVSISVESDHMFETSLNAISRFLAGRDPETGRKLLEEE